MQVSEKKSLSASLEDYLEAIFVLTGKAKVARSRDIADMLKVSRASVTGALRALKEKELINYKPYGYITLTDAGRSAAMEVDKKHHILKSFFTDVLAVKGETAQSAACKAEHVLGPEVIAKLLKFIKFVSNKNKNGENLSEEFSRYCKKSKKTKIK